MGTARLSDILLAHPGGQPAVLHGDDPGTCMSYAQLHANVAEFTARLKRQDVLPGARVVICLPNGPEAIVALLGTMDAGAIAVPVHEDEAAQLGEVANAAGASHRVEADASAGLAISDCPDGPADAVAATPVGANGDTALIRYSSGYSGTPKGVCLSAAQVSHMAQTLATAAHLTPTHRELIITPMAFSGAWQRVAATLAAGGSVGFADAGPLTVRGLLEDLHTFEATGFFATPSLLRILLAAPAADVSAGLARCQSIEIGSASLAAAELESFLGLTGAHVLVHYGLTECSRATLLDVRRHPDKLHTVGRSSPGVRIAFADGDGLPSAQLREGEILLQAPQLTSGYWRDAPLNAERFVDGWLRTRDLGELDDDGFLVYRGRLDDQINCGGLSFFPAEVERLIGAVDGVREYVIAGVDDPRGLYGQVPWAFVQPQDESDYRSSHFMQVARERLPLAKRPRRAVIVSDIPTTRSGKVDRLRTARLFGPGFASK